MANFQEVMRHWKRMCDTYTTEDAATCCKGCPMYSVGCGAIYEDGNADFDVIEREVMAWAAEHPEPVYPTWALWLCEQDIATIVPCFSDKRQYDAILNDIAYQPIPADIAQKLGIKPKENV